MNKFELAKITQKAFNSLCYATSNEASLGCKASALALLQQMAAKELVLKELGYWTTDDGKLTTTPPKPDPRHELAMKASTGDIEAAQELLRLMSGNDVY